MIADFAIGHARVFPPSFFAAAAPGHIAAAVIALAPDPANDCVGDAPLRDRTWEWRVPVPGFLILLPAFCITTLMNPASAQESVVVTGERPACVDVQVDGQPRPPLECLNEQLRATAQGAKPADPMAPITAAVGNGEPNKVGTFSHTGESIRMGGNFGKSAFPQRPATTFAPPAGAPHP